MQQEFIKKVLVFRRELIPYSETFISGQVKSLLTFSPYYVGTKIVDSNQLLNAKAIVPFGGRSQLYDRFFRWSGFIWPSWLNRIQQVNAQLIHAHFGIDGAFALSLAKQLELPLIVTFHGYDITATIHGKDEPGWWTHKIYMKRRRLLFEKAKLFIAVSKFIRSKLIEEGCPENKILVHYIGIDTNEFKPDFDVVRKPIVLFVGRLVEKKGCEYLIQAMSKVQVLVPEVELVIIGDGPLRFSLEQLARQSLRSYQFLGAQVPRNIRAWMNKARVFCVPSVTARSGDSEGFGMVFAEAQAMGLPVVSFATGGVPEAVAHDKTGFLAPERNSEVLALYILRLLEDHELWQYFSRNGQDVVRNIFNLHTQTRILEKIYQDVM